MKYKYISINIKPLPLNVVTDQGGVEYKKALREVSLAESAPELLYELNRILNAIYSLSYLSVVENELLPFVKSIESFTEKFK